MTGEMIRSILRLALERLLDAGPAAWDAYAWLEREHIQWCLDNIGDFHPWDAEALSTRDLLVRIHTLLGKGTSCDHEPPS